MTIEKIELVVYGVLTLTGFWLGYSYVPRLLARFRFKELIKKREETQEAVESMRIIINSGTKMDGTKIENNLEVKGERAPKRYKIGNQSPPDSKSPNDGKHE